MEGKATPIFIFSLPRSGSTLLQRMISSGGEVATASEPWVLLPILSYKNSGGVFSEYSQKHALMAVEDFNELSCSKKEFDKAIRDAMIDIYSIAAEGKEYFLDKTPRYSLICSDIAEVFGDEAQYIFLWRHPLSIGKSMYTSWKHWNRGLWNIGSFRVDFEKGINECIELSKNMKNANIIRYEDVVADPKREMNNLAENIGLSSEFELESIDAVAENHLQGRLGDSSGIEKYRVVMNKPVDEWREVFNNPIRVFWGRRIVSKWIGQSNMEYMGYDYNETMLTLSYRDVWKRTFSLDFFKDIFATFYYLFYWRFQPHILFGKYKSRFVLK